MEEDLGEITRLLRLTGAGDKDAENRLLGITYNELRRLARIYRRQERADLTLESADLVHEVYLRMCRNLTGCADGTHFYRCATRVMRHILVDHARERTALKRGAGAEAMPLPAFLVGNDAEAEKVLWMDQAITRLQRVHPRSAEVVELRFFCGLTTNEIGECLNVSGKTADRDWAIARAWLRAELGIAPETALP